MSPLLKLFTHFKQYKVVHTTVIGDADGLAACSDGHIFYALIPKSSGTLSLREHLLQSQQI